MLRPKNKVYKSRQFIYVIIVPNFEVILTLYLQLYFYSLYPAQVFQKMWENSEIIFQHLYYINRFLTRYFRRGNGTLVLLYFGELEDEISFVSKKSVEIIDEGLNKKKA